MPLTAGNAKIIDNFYIDEALQGINNGRTISQFRIRDNYFIYLDILALFALLPAPGAATILTFAIPLTAAQIKVLNSIPVLAVPAPGVGKAIEVISASARLVFNAVAYTSSSLSLQTNTATDPQNQSTIISKSANNFLVFGHFVTGLGDHIQLVQNEQLNIIADADSLVGDSPVTVYGAYRIITL